MTTLLTLCKGRTGMHWTEFVIVRTERSEVHTEMTEGHIPPLSLEQARSVSIVHYTALEPCLFIEFSGFRKPKVHGFCRKQSV